jgi:hypothetical protein
MAKPWTMPAWMERYRDLIGETGGNKIETLVNGKTIVQVNAPLAMIEVAVSAQVHLLDRLRKAGLLTSRI